MHIVLVGPELEENLALGYLAAALRAAGHRATVVAFDDDRDVPVVVERILALRAEVAGLSMMYQPRAAGFMELASRLRAGGFDGHIVAGGHFASIAAETVLRDCSGLDSVLRGEAEGSLVSLTRALAGELELAAVPGLVKRDGAGLCFGPRPARSQELDALTFPARDRPTSTCSGVHTAAVIASRGCRGHCGYCSISAFGRLSSGRVRRERSPDNIADELALLWRERSARLFVFEDDDFLCGDRAADLRRLAELHRAFSDRGLPPLALAIKARPDDLNEEIVAALRRLGLVQVFLGIENASAAALRALGRGVSTAANAGALETLGRGGLHIAANLLLWQPQTSLDELRANLDLMERFPQQLFSLARTEPYEGAPMTRRLARQGRLLGSYLGYDYRVEDARAELSWQLFRRTLAARGCEDGLIPLGQRLGLACALSTRFSSSSSVERAVSEARAALGSLALANRLALAELIELSERGGDVDMLAGDLASAVQQQDLLLRSRLARALDLVEVAQLYRPRGWRPAHGSRRRAAVPISFALAGALCCAHPSQSAQPQSPGLGPLAPAPPGGVQERHASISLMFGAGTGAGPLAPRALPDGSTTVQVSVYTDSGWRFDRFELSDGTLERAIVTPDGRTVIASFHAGARDGEQALTAVLIGPNGERLEQRETFRQRGGQAFPAVDPMHEQGFDRRRRPGCDPPGGPPNVYCREVGMTPGNLLRQVLAEDRPLWLYAQNVQTALGGDTLLTVGVGAAPSVRSEGPRPVRKLERGVAPPPMVLESREVLHVDALECEQGTLTLVDLAKAGEPQTVCETSYGCGRGSTNTKPAPRMPANYVVLTYSPYSSEVTTKLKQGSFKCRIRLRAVRPGGKERLLETRPRVEFDGVGSVRFAAPAPR